MLARNIFTGLYAFGALAFAFVSIWAKKIIGVPAITILILILLASVIFALVPLLDNFDNLPRVPSWLYENRVKILFPIISAVLYLIGTLLLEGTIHSDNMLITLGNMLHYCLTLQGIGIVGMIVSNILVVKYKLNKEGN